jgi:hypothetical protein
MKKNYQNRKIIQDKYLISLGSGFKVLALKPFGGLSNHFFY